MPASLRSRTLWGITLLAVVLRLLVAFRQLSPLDTGDASEYVTIARHLRFDRAFSFGAVRRWGEAPHDDPTSALRPTAYRAPLFPAEIAVLWWGDMAHPPVRAVQTCNALFGGATTALTNLIANSLAPGWGFVAG